MTETGFHGYISTEALELSQNPNTHATDTATFANAYFILKSKSQGANDGGKICAAKPGDKEKNVFKLILKNKKKRRTLLKK